MCNHRTVTFKSLKCPGLCKNLNLNLISAFSDVNSDLLYKSAEGKGVGSGWFPLSFQHILPTSLPPLPTTLLQTVAVHQSSWPITQVAGPSVIFLHWHWSWSSLKMTDIQCWLSLSYVLSVGLLEISTWEHASSTCDTGPGQVSLGMGHFYYKFY